MDSDSITAIVIIGIPTICGFAYAAFKSCLKYEERKLELRGYTSDFKSGSSTIDRLEEMIKQVQQTSNEYDLSIQHTLDSIEQRLTKIESSNGIAQPQPLPYSGTSSQPEEQIRIGHETQ